jgi:hypothetical protein
MDRLACPLHRPTVHSCQTKGQCLLPDTILSRRAATGGGALLGDAKPPCLDICEGVDRLDTCVIEVYMKRIAFTRICLLYVRIIMVSMHVSLVELPFQIVMGWIIALECMLSGAHGLLQPYSISSGSECHHPPRL